MSSSRLAELTLHGTTTPDQAPATVEAPSNALTLLAWLLGKQIVLPEEWESLPTPAGRHLRP